MISFRISKNTENNNIDTLPPQRASPPPLSHSSQSIFPLFQILQIFTSFAYDNYSTPPRLVVKLFFIFAIQFYSGINKLL
jgi:hypothetical protein